MTSHSGMHGATCRKGSIMATPLLSALLPLSAQAEFILNFQNNPNIVASVANVACDGGNGGGMGGMGMMGNLGPGCGTDRFVQELVNDNGRQYYHVILQDQTQDFAMEFYIRSAGCCWFSGGGMMGGADAPYSASNGDPDNRLANAFQPLAGTTTSGNGTGNPSRIYMRQINNDAGMTQTFDKPLESRKPRINQRISDGTTELRFELDMGNGDYTDFTSPASFVNTLTLNLPDGRGDFAMHRDAPQGHITAGLYRYLPGNGFGASNGRYDYADQGLDVFSTDWLSYCDPAQNPDNQCQFSPGGGGGGMMGGMGGMGGM